MEGARSPDTSRPPTNAKLTLSLTIRLYISHFLSTWNSRLFEAAVVYFLAAIYPNNLLPVSVYALVRNAAVIALTAPMGRWIDRGNRLTIVQVSIIGQRVSVVASSLVFWFMYRFDSLDDWLRNSLFAVTVILACAEKLSASVNLVAVERDWVVVLTEDDEAGRIVMNARLRRIDLFCKLVGPLVISLVAAASVTGAIFSVVGMNLLSVAIECVFIRTVFNMAPSLRRNPSTEPNIDLGQAMITSQVTERGLLRRLQAVVSDLIMVPALKAYFRHPAVVPSFVLAMLYFTVLAFSGQMLTYLLASNITIWQVGIIRAISTIFELSATWIAPRLASRIGLIRAGSWSLSWLMIWLAAGVTWLFSHWGKGVPVTSVLIAAGLAGAVALSRVGLWGYDLSAQNIIQNEVQDDMRGTFSMVETAFQNLFDMLSWGLTIIWSRPSQFQWPVTISVAAVYAAGGLFTMYLRQQRGHLVHVPRCLSPKVSVVSV